MDILRRSIAALSLPLAFAPQILAAQALSAASQRSVVVIDAAHGGDDTGARLGNQMEKAYTLAFSAKLRSLLAARGFGVVTTRESDANVDPGRRAEIANHVNALACLSLHATQAGSGVHLFVSSLAPAEGSRFVPWKTAQSRSITRSLSLAGVVNSALAHAGVAVTLGRTALPGIDSMTCPAVAVEIAPQKPVSAQGDAKGANVLDDAQYEAHVAEALAAALVEWRSDVKGDRQP